MEDHLMNWKHLVAICVLAAVPALALAQKPPAAAKPTKADVQKVVQLISADKAKTKIYCDMTKLEGQLSGLDEKKDAKKIEAIGKQLDEMGAKLGPEYVKLMEAMQEIDPESAEGKELFAAFEPLDKSCGKA
jgi:hypothetical protein